ncbi:MAG TPA: hypothetical protein VMO17_11205 [Terriglobia bacterium]|nr:hypothetical protein [Terriglobia bacterium]
MKKTTALLTLTLLISLASGAFAREHTSRYGRAILLSVMAPLQAPPQAAKAPQWKSREEYDAYNAMATATDPDKKIALAEAFLQKFANSDFKSGAYLTEMQAYFTQGKSDQAIGAAKKVLEVDPDNLDALAFLAYVFPFTFKDTDTDKAAELSRAESDARHGLDVLQKFQKPANVTDDQFKQYVNPKRALFNGAIGFVALQGKNYPGAITSLQAAIADNPSEVYTFYRLGLAYHYSTPPDDDHAIWYIARAVALAQAAKNPAADDINKFLKGIYIKYHGTDTGLPDIITQAAGSPNPPDGFKVVHAEAPAKTGNNTIDAFNTLTYPLTLGGETAQQQWDGIKGQPVANFGGTVASVEKGTDANQYLVRIAILEKTKAAGGYDIELKDSSQPDVKNLQKGDSVLFKGTIDSYVATPSMILTLAGEVTSDLPDKPAGKPVHKTH